MPDPLPFPPQTWARIVAFLAADAHHWGRIEIDVCDGHIAAVRITESVREDARQSVPVPMRRAKG